MREETETTIMLIGEMKGLGDGRTMTLTEGIMKIKGQKSRKRE